MKNDGAKIEMERRDTKKKKKKRNSSIASSIKSILRHADTFDKSLMVLGFLGAIGDGMSTPLLLLLFSRLMNDVGNSENFDPNLFSHAINKNALFMVCVSCGLFLVAFLEGYCWTRTGERQATRLRAIYLKAVLRQDVEYFDLNVSNMSEVVTSVTNDTLVIQDALSSKVPNFFMNVSFFVGSYMASFLLQWRLALVGFPFILLLVIPGLVYGRTLMGLARKARDEYAKAGNVAEQAVSSIRTVYAFVGERTTEANFSAALQGSVRLGLKQGLAKGLAIGSNAVVFCIWAFMAYYGSRLVMYHGAEGGTVFAVGTGLTAGGLAFGASLSNIKYLAEALSAGERILEVINRVPTIDPDNTSGELIEDVSGCIEFRRVDFSYPSRLKDVIFEDFCLTIPAGKTVALVGSSGSGKSTVISLLQRFYAPVNGEILLDGVPIDKINLKWLRSQMGLVSQEPTLFATSIKENILFGKEDASMKEVTEAAKSSNAHDFISQLPQGYETQVGERGVQMSGGQKQRIAIARAIIKSPRILLLDEATSALDMESERVVQEALENAAIGRTTIMVAHRLSTIKNADLIAVIQQGQVREIGSHEELIRKQEGLYYSLVSLQNAERTRSSTENDIRVLETESSKHNLSDSNTNSDVGPRLSHAVDENGDKSRTSYKSLFARLLTYSKPEWKQEILAFLGASLSGAVQPIYSFLMGSMISVYFLPNHDEIKDKTRIYAWCFAGFFMFSLFVDTLQHYNFTYVGEYTAKRIREVMMAKIMTFEVGWFDQDENSNGAICARLSRDASMVRSLLGDQMSLLLQAISGVMVACVMGLVIAWRLAIVIIAVEPLIIVCFYGRQSLLKSMSQKAIEAQNESSKLAAEAVSNHRIITAFSSQERILRMFNKAQEGPLHENKRQSWFAGLGLGASQSLTKINLAFDFWYGGRLISDGHITSKQLFETYLILLSTGKVIADAGSMTMDIAKGSSAIKSIFSILDRKTKIDPEDQQGHKPKTIEGKVEIREVDFVYPARPKVIVLKGFSLDIEAGNSVALVGQSGSGKSTIIGLIERFYDPIRGTIKIDGRHIRSYNLRSLRKHIALVSQDPSLFAGSIRQNITYGVDNEIDESEIVLASKAANAHDFISGMKDGYDTWCGDRGVQLSGGQKQRIAIARAILKNPEMLLLDEATSALDSESEKIVHDAIEKLMVGRTSVVIAHRLSTIRNCDMIAILEKGEVVEKGNHSDLMAKGNGGAYHALVSLQMTNNIETVDLIAHD